MPDVSALDMLRASLDPVRLAVLGDAAGGSIEVERIAKRLGVDRRNVADAVGQLRASGLIDENGDLATDVLRQIGQDLPRDGRAGEPIEGPWTPREAEVLGRFFDGDRLVKLPSSQAKRRLVLDKIAQFFEPGRRYPERDVNFRIQLIYRDYAAIRRYLVDEGFMDRADGAYWRTGGRFDLDEPPIESEAPIHVLATSLSHVELRPYTWDMVDALTEAANDERIPRYMGDQFTHPYTTDDAETWIEMATKSDPPTQYAIFVNDALAGGLGGFPMSGEGTGHVEIGWWLSPQYWRQGVTTAAVRALVDEFLGQRGYMRLWAPVMRPNIASAKVAEAAGLTLEGVARSAYLKHGVRHDQLNYAITRGDWVANR